MRSPLLSAIQTVPDMLYSSVMMDYAPYIWSAFLFTFIVIAAITVTSVRALRRKEKELAILENNDPT